MLPPPPPALNEVWNRGGKRGGPGWICMCKVEEPTCVSEGSGAVAFVRQLSCPDSTLSSIQEVDPGLGRNINGRSWCLVPSVPHVLVDTDVWGASRGYCHYTQVTWNVLLGINNPPLFVASYSLISSPPEGSPSLSHWLCIFCHMSPSGPRVWNLEFTVLLNE